MAEVFPRETHRWRWQATTSHGFSYAADGNLYLSSKVVGGWDPDPEIVASVGYWGGLSSLQFNSLGQACVAFVDATDMTGNLLDYACKTSQGWTTQTVDAVGWQPDFVSLAFGTDGQPRIAYCKISGDYPDMQTYLSSLNVRLPARGLRRALRRFPELLVRRWR